MRYLDELVAMYAGKDPHTQKFVLTQVLDHEPGVSSDGIIELLWRETAASEALVRRQARYVLGQYLVRHTAHVLGPTARRVRRAPAAAADGAPTEAPAGSPAGSCQGPGPGQGQDRGAGQAESAVLSMITGARADDIPICNEPPPIAAIQIIEGASERLGGLLDRVLALSETGSLAVRRATSLVLGRLWTGRTLDAIETQVAGADAGFGLCSALADMGIARAHAMLAGVIDRTGASRPDLFALLRGYPSTRSLSLLAREEDRTDALGRTNIAVALANFDGPQCRELIERLIRRKEGWVTAYVLDALAGQGSEEDLALVKMAYDLEPHDFVRVQAVRAAGSIPCQSSIQMCLDVLGGPSRRLHSFALESLARLGLPAQELAEHALPLLDGEFVRGRVLAVALAWHHHEARAHAALSQMLAGQEEILRMEGAFLLPYVGTPDAGDILMSMACIDPSVPVRCQAVRSLGEIARAGGDLERPLGVLPTADLPALIETCRGLTQAALAGIKVPLEPIVAGLADARSATSRAVLLRGLGLVTAARGERAPEPMLAALRDSDLQVVIGALEGLGVMGDALDLSAVTALLTHPDARVRSRAALVSFLAGDIARADVLDPMLAGSDENTQMAALDALLRIGLALPATRHGGRFASLVARIVAAPSPRPAPSSGDVPVLDIVALQAPRAAIRRTRAIPALRLTGRMPAPVVPERRPVPAGMWSLAVALAVLAIVGVEVVRVASASRPASLTVAASSTLADRPGWLRIWAVRGHCERRRTGDTEREAHCGDLIGPGDEVWTEAGGRLRLQDPSGSTITVQSSSHLGVAESTSKGKSLHYGLDRVTGTCDVEVHPGCDARIALRGASIDLADGAVEVSDGADSGRLRVTRGDASLHFEGGKVQVVTSGEDVVVP